MEAPQSPTLSELFDVLSSSRRRHTLYALLEDKHTSIEYLSVQIAASEQAVPMSAVSDDDRHSVATTLVHSHLPRLADHEIVEYDTRSGDVVRGDAFARVRSTVERTKTVDGEVALEGGAVESSLYSDPFTDSAITE